MLTHPEIHRALAQEHQNDLLAAARRRSRLPYASRTTNRRRARGRRRR